MIKLLLVEDDTNLSYMIQSGLENVIGDYEVITAVNGEEGLKRWKEDKPEVIISDIDMPVMDGFEMVKKIRETDGNTLIIFASALIAAKDVTRGYNLDANNYVKKPFIVEELDAHIKALLKIKNRETARNQERRYQLGRFMLDAEQSTVKDEEGNLETLTPREAGILEMLCQNRGNTVKKETIINRFWEMEKDFYTSRSLDVFMSTLRKTIAEDDSIQIKTVRGVGYILLG